MKTLNYIYESLLDDEETIYQETDTYIRLKNKITGIYDELSKSKYKLTFKSKLNNIENLIHHIDLTDEHNKNRLTKIFGNNWEQFKNIDVFSLAVWRNGTLMFTDNAKYSQGLIVSSRNNTEFKYYITCDENGNCELYGFELGFYGRDDLVSSNPFKFKIKI